MTSAERSEPVQEPEAAAAKQLETLSAGPSTDIGSIASALPEVEPEEASATELDVDNAPSAAGVSSRSELQGRIAAAFDSARSPGASTDLGSIAAALLGIEPEQPLAAPVDQAVPPPSAVDTLSDAQSSSPAASEIAPAVALPAEVLDVSEVQDRPAAANGSVPGVASSSAAARGEPDAVAVKTGPLPPA